MRHFSQFLLLLSAALLSMNILAQFQGGVEVIHQKNGSGTFGWAVSELSDIDGDGITDFMVGASQASRLIVYSGASGAILFDINNAGSTLGYSLADAGDVNNDGTTDFIGGAVTAAGTGQALVYSGLDGSVIWTLSGEATGDRFGAAVSSAGDVDADGFADLLVGAESNGIAGALAGRAYVFSGRTGGLIRTYEAESAGDRFGGGVAALGDLNNDGVGDHLIGAYSAGNGGKAYVHSGADGQRLFELLPDTGAATFGQFFVANPGDVDADGTDDIYVGDFSHANGAGRAYVFSGKNREVLFRFSGNPGDGAGPGRGAGDVNNDGHADLIVGFWTGSNGGNGAGFARVFSGLDGSVMQSFVHTPVNSNLGFDAVGIGDVNGDGKFDFLLSAATGNRVYVVAGTTERLFQINPGLNGSWFNQQTPGQGFFLEVFPDIPLVFLAWFTYDTTLPDGSVIAVVGDPGHRWLTAQGGFSGDTALLDLVRTSGGLFDNPAAVTNTVPGSYGSIRLQFADCLSGIISYTLVDSGLAAEIPIARIAQDNVALCNDLADDGQLSAGPETR